MPTGEPEALRRWQFQTFALLWGAYASYYLCRLNFAVAQPLILKEFPDWSAAQVGMIPSVYAAVYAVGQFLNGQLGERLGGRRLMTIAMILIVMANLGFSLVTSYPGMLALWGLNGLAQSAGWSLVVKTITNWTTTRRRGLVVGLISTCYQVGNVLAWLLAGILCDAMGWRAAFSVPAMILAPVAVAFWFGLRDGPEEIGLPRVRDDLDPEVPSREGPALVTRASALEVLRLTLTNRMLWVLGIAFFCANGVRYAFMNWAVTYMNDFHGRSIKGSAFTAVALPLIGAIGAVSAGWISDRLFRGRRAPVCAVALYALAVVCAAFIFIPEGRWMEATAMLGLAGFLIYGPDMLMSGAATADVHPSATAAATGFTMALGAAGSIFSGAGVGWLRDQAPRWISGEGWGAFSFLPRTQWTIIFTVLALLSLVPASLMAALWNARPRGR